MSTSAIVLTGTVTPDGELSIHQKVPLPAGPVQVTIEPASPGVPVLKNWWQQLQESRAELEARGAAFRSVDEIEAEREAFRAEPGE